MELEEIVMQIQQGRHDLMEGLWYQSQDCQQNEQNFRFHKPAEE